MSEYHVSKNGKDSNSGSNDNPFLTISKAAEVAVAGDIITVHQGEYREWIKPKNGGTIDKPIIYQSAENERAIIKGSEIVTGWAKEGKIWRASVSNDMFGDYNPFAEKIDGDWLVSPREPFRHTGGVYINGKSLLEVFSVQEVCENTQSWFATVDKEQTTVYANFGRANPTKELTEINVRKCCFYPDRTGINYLTIRGFEMAQCASTWAPPTAEQFAMLGVNWGKGWIIEDNILHHARCSAISLGKNATLEDNLATKSKRKSGYQYQIENVFVAKDYGWTKENIGSHTVRNNLIYDCGQAGILGHMGCAFSKVYKNHIYNIANRGEFVGWETACIKFHAAIDTQIYGNYLHHCSGTSGIWLDWQTQGTRVSGNVLHDNDGCLYGDIFVEVSHGPYMVDNNIFASNNSVRTLSQGGAYVHNLLFGYTQKVKTLHRFTPYHFNHSTDIAGFCCIYGDDDRWYQNIFAGNANEEGEICGTAQYNGSPVSIEEFIEIESGGEGTKDGRRQPAYINGNCYFNNALPFDREENNIVSQKDVKPKLINENGKVYLEIDIPEELLTAQTKIIGKEELVATRISFQAFENPDGSDMKIDIDFFGAKRGKTPTVGPFENLSAGLNKILIWEDGK